MELGSLNFLSAKAGAVRVFPRNLYMTLHLRGFRIIWGGDESLLNFQSLLKHLDKVKDIRMRARTLNSIAVMHDRKGEYEHALKLYNQSLEIKGARRSGRDSVYFDTSYQGRVPARKTYYTIRATEIS